MVHTDNGEDVNCKIKGNFRLKGIRTTNPVAVGDRVTISVNPDGNAFITAIQPRKKLYNKACKQPVKGVAHNSGQS